MVCVRPGRGVPVSRRRRWCSDSCRKKVERGRDAVQLHKVSAKRCVKCGAVLYGEKLTTCPSCGGEGFVQIHTVRCPNCGIERIGDTEGPCPDCEKGTK
jgi:RNA polymerase subunit RPABC4/transcription elongation factor Spt4